MGFKVLQNKIDELRELVGGWGEEQPAQLEMDLALDRVKRIYELLRFPNSVEEEQIQEEQVQEVEVSAVEEAAEEAFVVVDIVEEESAQEEEIKEESEEEETPQVIEEEMTNEEDLINILKSNKSVLDRIISLYSGESEVVAPQQTINEVSVEPATQEAEEVFVTAPEIDVEIEESIEVEPIAQPDMPQRVEAIEAPQAHNRVSSQLGINDRFLLANDLFGGDFDALARAVDALDSQPTFDDAMIYIAENYQWSGESDGAKLLMSLLQSSFTDIKRV